MKYHLILLLTAASITCYSQKYKLKNDILYKDKEPVALVEGKSGMVKTELTFKTMDGEPFLIVTEDVYSCNMPGAELITWYVYTFPLLQKEMIVKKKNSFFGTKQYLKYEFENKGVHFYPDGLHEDELSLLGDYSQQLHADTMQVVNSIQFFQENLSAGSIERPVSEPVTFRSFENSPGLAVIQGYNDNKKPVIIGKIEYYHNPGISISDPARRHTIKIYKKLPKSITMNGEQTSYLPAGYIDLFETIPVLFLYEKGKNLSHLQYRIDRMKEGMVIAKEAVQYMVKEGLL